MSNQRWFQARAKDINKRLHHKYGNGWGHMSEDARENARSHEILRLLAAQAMDKYEPAIEVVQGLQTALED